MSDPELGLDWAFGVTMNPILRAIEAGRWTPDAIREAVRGASPVDLNEAEWYVRANDIWPLVLLEDPGLVHVFEEARGMRGRSGRLW